MWTGGRDGGRETGVKVLGLVNEVRVEGVERYTHLDDGLGDTNRLDRGDGIAGLVIVDSVLAGIFLQVFSCRELCSPRG